MRCNPSNSQWFLVLSLECHGKGPLLSCIYAVCILPGSPWRITIPQPQLMCNTRFILWAAHQSKPTEVKCVAVSARAWDCVWPSRSPGLDCHTLYYSGFALMWGPWDTSFVTHRPLELRQAPSLAGTCIVWHWTKTPHSLSGTHNPTFDPPQPNCTGASIVTCMW